MRLTTPLRTLETKLRSTDEVPGVLIVLEQDGVRRNWEAAVIDRTPIDSGRAVTRFRHRFDGRHLSNFGAGSSCSPSWPPQYDRRCVSHDRIVWVLSNQHVVAKATFCETVWGDAISAQGCAGPGVA